MRSHDLKRSTKITKGFMAVALLVTSMLTGFPSSTAESLSRDDDFVAQSITITPLLPAGQMDVIGDGSSCGSVGDGWGRFTY